MKLKEIKQLDIDFTSQFEKQRKAAPQEIRKAFLEALALFLHDHKHPTLRNHPLKEIYAGYRSINVTEDWRALFKEKGTEEKKTITFHRTIIDEISLRLSKKSGSGRA
ncbi:MAG TPA: type II toxin-antitoxin system mRNA interferase toxin, RelE/StbE family [Candidatus Saccharimonadales bacterium]|nr:type II toxin-antitoxin system mRNA interferase toxin, RelE/StbE family [Candidatus Saccharimonadales bacterium]